MTYFSHFLSFLKFEHLMNFMQIFFASFLYLLFQLFISQNKDFSLFFDFLFFHLFFFLLSVILSFDKIRQDKFWRCDVTFLTFDFSKLSFTKTFQMTKYCCLLSKDVSRLDFPKVMTKKVITLQLYVRKVQ